VTKYLGQQPHIGKASGLEPELIERIKETMGGWPARPGGIEDAMKLVSDEVKDRTCEWIQAGISYPVILPLSENYGEIVEAFAPGRW